MRTNPRTRVLIKCALIAFLAGMLTVTTVIYANAEENDGAKTIYNQVISGEFEEASEEHGSCVKLLPNGEKIGMHRYGSYQYLEPTSDSSGYMVYTCDICGQTVKEVFQPLKTYTCSEKQNSKNGSTETFEDEDAAFAFDRPEGGLDENG